ncbi:hypothetical protein ACA910_020384 [Epithemia clementina (nom. ined.)]
MKGVRSSHTAAIACFVTTAVLFCLFVLAQEWGPQHLELLFLSRTREERIASDSLRGLVHQQEVKKEENYSLPHSTPLSPLSSRGVQNTPALPINKNENTRDGSPVAVVRNLSGKQHHAERKLPVTGFVHADGLAIVDGNGDNFLFRGFGVGGWMLQESYMMLVGDSATSGQHSIFNQVRDVVGGQPYLDLYREAWLESAVTEADIQEMKAIGFNSVRVPMHYNLFTLPIEEEPVPGADTWLSEGFDLLDMILQWCQTHEIYIVLDLHAAPGGQGRDAGINDYDSTKPSLWESDENVRKTIALWEILADRYKDEIWIAGYDIINEPNWNFESGHPNGCDDVHNAPLKAFYDAIIPAIRAKDPNHLLIVEGNCWSNNHNGLWPIADNNVALSLHRYWIENSVDSIQKFLDWQTQYQVPLYMGESGENYNGWFTEAVDLLEWHNIGWAWWPWKKMQYTDGDSQGAYRIVPPDDYLVLVDYWSNPTPATNPDSDWALNVMLQVAHASRLENCLRNDGAIAALTRTINAVSCVDSIPLEQENGFTLRLEAEAYCQVYGFVMEESTDGRQNAGYTDAGDWISWKITVPSAITTASGTAYQVGFSARISSFEGNGGFVLELSDGSGEMTTLATFDTLQSTGGWQAWSTVVPSSTAMMYVDMAPPGEYTLYLRSLAQGWNFDWIELNVMEVAAPTSPTTSPTAAASRGGGSINGTPTATPAPPPPTDDCEDHVIMEQVGYTVRLEAETNCDMFGFIVEDSNGGGQNVGWTDADDWISWRVSVPSSSPAVQVRLSARIASLNGAEDGLVLQLGDGNEVVDLASFDTFESTGDWQAWITVSSTGTYSIPPGEHTLYIRALGQGWNLDWVELSVQPTGTTATPIVTIPPGNPVCAQSTPVTLLPGRIEAENYCEAHGVEMEPTSDEGGGQNLAFIDNGDWVAYNVKVSSAGSYLVEYRIASFNGDGSFQLEWFGDLGRIGTILDNFPSTGDWQNWEIVSHVVVLPAGSYTLAIKSLGAGWNINWINVSPVW